MEYNITIPKIKHHKAALTLINSFIKLTEFELNLIVAILDNGFKSLTTANRKILRNQLGTDVYTFNNYIKRLKERGYLIDGPNGLELPSKLVQAANDKEIKITIDVN